MADRRRHGVARALLAAACLFGAAADGSAADDRVTVAAEAGLDGNARAGRWTPVRISIENSGSDIDGELVITAGSSRLVRQLSLPSPSRKRLEHYIRLPSADIDRIRVALVVGSREIQAVETAVRVLPGQGSFVLCIAHVGNQPAATCTASIAPAALPLSWRGYDAVDDLDRPAASDGTLNLEQRLAITRWRIRRARERTTAPASGPFEPPPLASQIRRLIVVYAGAFPILVLTSRRLGRSPRVFYAAVIVAIAAGSAAATAQGRIGEGASIVLADSTIISAAEGVDDALLSTRGIAVFPSFGRFELRPGFDDGVAEARRDSAPLQFADDGISVLSGVFGKGQRVGFDLEGFSPMPTLTVARSSDILRITNATSGDLTNCELPPRFEPRDVKLLRAGEAVSVRASAGSGGATLRCRMDRLPSTLRSSTNHVGHTGSAVLVYALSGWETPE